MKKSRGFFVGKKEAPKRQSNTQTVTFLSVREAAEKTGKTRKTILAWCHSGKLPATAIDYGQKLTFKIPPSALELIEHERIRVTAQKEKGTRGRDNHRIFVSSWIRAMQKGWITGKAFSYLTSHNTVYRGIKADAVRCLLEPLLAQRPRNDETMFSRKGLVRSPTYLVV